jgi:Protein O-mannosyl-transferase TMEM260-like
VPFAPGPDATEASPALPDLPSIRSRFAISAVIAAIAFVLYRATLLPGLDFGDTASFQAGIGEADLTPRQAYPLYYAIGNVALALTGAEPAHVMNLVSAIAGAFAVAIFVWVAIDLTGSVGAGAAGGLWLASSYTFWTQAIIAEVYTLHLALVGLVLASILWWDRQRTPTRLTVVFAVYALAFGNHLMSILLLPALVLFVATAPGGPRVLMSPRTIGVAILCAAAGASQYLWNIWSLWHLPDVDWTLPSLARAFWFDVTKSDWRDTMILTVHPAALRQRPAMYLFELQQQVGIAGIAFACLGAAALFRRWRTALLVWSAYLPALVFAATYNVGDAHVFFLPSHYCVLLALAAGVAATLALVRTVVPTATPAVTAIAIVAAVALPAWRAWDTLPAVDRHDDRRPIQWLNAVTRGLSDRALLVGDVNWQLENGLDYYSRRLRPDLNVIRAGGTLLTLPFLIHDNLAEGREVVATPLARERIRAAYGDLFTFRPDERDVVPPLTARLEGVSRGTPYVLTLLAPYPDLPFDRPELAEAVEFLTGGTATLGHEPSYTVLAGIVGARPTVDRRSDRPFRDRFHLGSLDVDVRMESWLPTDTIRRAGFGHVVVGRQHALTVERGVSVVTLPEDGPAPRTEYASGLLAPLPRFRVSMTPLDPRKTR